MIALIKKTIKDIQDNDPDFTYSDESEDEDDKIEDKKIVLFKNFKQKHKNIQAEKLGNFKPFKPKQRKKKKVGEEEVLEEEVDELESLLKFTKINLSELASDVWDIYFEQYRMGEIDETVDIYEIQMLMDIIGIKKNETEIKMKLVILAQKNPKDYLSDKYFSFDNFLELVESFKTYRIDDKLLVNAFQIMEVNGDGLIDIANLRKVNTQFNLNFSDQEMFDILNYFNFIDISNPSLSFEDFCNLYYQG